MANRSWFVALLFKHVCPDPVWKPVTSYVLCQSRKGGGWSKMGMKIQSPSVQNEYGNLFVLAPHFLQPTPFRFGECYGRGRSRSSTAALVGGGVVQVSIGSSLRRGWVRPISRRLPKVTERLRAGTNRLSRFELRARKLERYGLDPLLRFPFSGPVMLVVKWPYITANLRTKILDFRGFDSSIILMSRGGILMSIGHFPE